MIHRYRNNGYNIVLDVNSGSVHAVDDMTYEIIPLYESHSPEEIADLLGGSWPREEILEACGELASLTADGRLFTPDTSNEWMPDPSGREPVVKALCLHVAHDCNLSCRYCFAGEGEYHGDRALMSYEVGCAALDFLIARSGARRNLEVDFFGGEPLLDWEVVKQLVAYGRRQEAAHDKRFRFTLTTNGVLLSDEITEFLNREMDNVVLSIDGRKEVHDAMRPFRGGQGSYDVVVPKCQRFAERRGEKEYYVRGTYTHRNLDFAEDVLHLSDLGFSRISVEPVVAENDAPYALREEDLPLLFAEYDRLAAEMLRREREGKGFHFFHFMIDLEGGPCAIKRLRGCGSGTEYLAVTPWGDLYPCHQFVGNEEFRMGNVWDGVTRTDLRDAFEKVSVLSKAECRDCFAKYYCSGGCAANAYHFCGDINGTYAIGCELQRKRIECAIMRKVAQAVEEEEIEE